MSAFSLGFKATAAAIEAVRQIRNGARAALESTGHAACVAIDTTKSTGNTTADAVTGFFRGVKVAVENRGRAPAQGDLFAEPVHTPTQIENQPLCQEVVVGRKSGSARIPHAKLLKACQRLGGFITALVITDVEGLVVRIDVQENSKDQLSYRLVTRHGTGGWRQTNGPITIQWDSTRTQAGWKAIDIEVTEMPL